MSDIWRKLGRRSANGRAILALAPMAGITDSAFRQICRKFGADVVYTEMVSADGLYYESKKTLELLRFSKNEHPVIIQLFGKNPAVFTKAAAIAERAGFDGIDINFGCPAKKVAGHGGGVTLMRDLAKCRLIIEAAIAGTKLPVSVKLRTSINKEGGKVTAADFLRSMADLPIAAVMIHGRSYEKPFDGEIDYRMIKECAGIFKRQHPYGVVLGNGGIKSPEAAKIMIDSAECDGVGLARGLYGKPWLFWQIRKYLKNGSYSEFSRGQVIRAIIGHAKLAFKAKHDFGLVELRKHLLWYVSGWPEAKTLRPQLVRAEKISDLRAVLRQK